MKSALVEKRLVEEASVLKKVVEVLLVITEEEARRVPFNVSVLTAERYRRTSPNEIPPVFVVDEAKESVANGVVVPRPRRFVEEA